MQKSEIKEGVLITDRGIVYKIVAEGTNWYHHGLEVLNDGKHSRHETTGMCIQKMEKSARDGWVPDTFFSLGVLNDYDSYTIMAPT